MSRASYNDPLEETPPSAFGLSSAGLFGRVDSCPPSPAHTSPFANDFDFASSDLLPPDQFPSLDPINLIPPWRDQDRSDQSGTSNSSFPVPPAAPADEPIPDLRPRGDKEELSGRGGSEERKARRAANNRKAARESRIRKAEYVKELQDEIRGLRQQVEFYRQKLGKYELIEKHRNSFGYELYAQVANVANEMKAMKKDPSDAAAARKVIEAKLDQFVEERRTAMEQLARAMVEIIAPLPQRVFFWVTEHNLELQDLERLSKATGNMIPPEQLRLIVDTLKSLAPDVRTIREAKVFFATSSMRIRRMVKGLLEHQKCIQEEMKRIAWFVFSNFLPRVDMSKLQLMAQFMMSLKLRPELSDCSLYQLTQSDFGMSTSLTRLAAEYAKRTSAVGGSNGTSGKRVPEQPKGV